MQTGRVKGKRGVAAAAEVSQARVPAAWARVREEQLQAQTAALTRDDWYCGCS